MVINDLLRIPLVLLMATTQSVWLLLLLHAAICACTALFMPSRQSLIPEVVPERTPAPRKLLSGGVISIVHMLGPPLGVFLYRATGGLLASPSLKRWPTSRRRCFCGDCRRNRRRQSPAQPPAT